jgi:hypothetical protein
MENLDLTGPLRCPADGGPLGKALMRRPASGPALACALLAASCGMHADPPTLGERLKGNWYYEQSFPDREFLRTEKASLDVYRTTMHLNYNVSWDCGSTGPCPGEAPQAFGGYFEGIFRDLGDSLALQDAIDTVAFRNVTDTGFTLLINGRLSFPLRRR